MRLAEKFQSRLPHSDIAFLAKTRTGHNVAKTLAVVGDVEGRTCVLVDESRSVLDAIDRAFLLDFLDQLVAAGRSVRVFFFDTAIREVTDVFAGARGDPATALERAEVAWGGGTRIGESLGTLRERWRWS